MNVETLMGGVQAALSATFAALYAKHRAPSSLGVAVFCGLLAISMFITGATS